MATMTRRVVAWKLLDTNIFSLGALGECDHTFLMRAAHAPARRGSTTVVQTVCTLPYYESGPVQTSYQALLTMMSPRVPL